MKKIIKILFILLIVVTLTGCHKEETKKYTIISTIFPGYDFSRAITKGNEEIEVKMLLRPGGEMHDFEPTPKDIKSIRNSDIFIYVGGESDSWINDILKDIKSDKTKLIRLMDLVDTKEEEIVEGMEREEEDEEKELDEHVWTSPVNAIKMTEEIKKEIIKMDSTNKDLYENNSNNYIDELKKIDSEVRNIVANSKRKELVFGDRFPLRYFTEEYGLTYYAAFSGCSEASEASAKTVSYLIKKVKENNIPVVLKIELSSDKIAKQISKETNAKVLEFNSAHNISKEDFTNGTTYVDIMKENIKVLKQALN